MFVPVRLGHTLKIIFILALFLIIPSPTMYDNGIEDTFQPSQNKPQPDRPIDLEYDNNFGTRSITNTVHEPQNDYSIMPMAFTVGGSPSIPDDGLWHESHSTQVQYYDFVRGIDSWSRSDLSRGITGNQGLRGVTPDTYNHITTDGTDLFVVGKDGDYTKVSKFSTAGVYSGTEVTHTDPVVGLFYSSSSIWVITSPTGDEIPETFIEYNSALVVQKTRTFSTEGVNVYAGGDYSDESRWEFDESTTLFWYIDDDEVSTWDRERYIRSFNLDTELDGNTFDLMQAESHLDTNLGNNYWSQDGSEDLNAYTIDYSCNSKDWYGETYCIYAPHWYGKDDSSTWSYSEEQPITVTRRATPTGVIFGLNAGTFNYHGTNGDQDQITNFYNDPDVLDEGNFPLDYYSSSLPNWGSSVNYYASQLNGDMLMDFIIAPTTSESYWDEAYSWDPTTNEHKNYRFDFSSDFNFNVENGVFVVNGLYRGIIKAWVTARDFDSVYSINGKNATDLANYPNELYYDDDEDGANDVKGLSNVEQFEFFFDGEMVLEFDSYSDTTPTILNNDDANVEVNPKSMIRRGGGEIAGEAFYDPTQSNWIYIQQQGSTEWKYSSTIHKSGTSVAFPSYSASIDLDTISDDIYYVGAGAGINKLADYDGTPVHSVIDVTATYGDSEVVEYGDGYWLAGGYNLQDSWVITRYDPDFTGTYDIYESKDHIATSEITDITIDPVDNYFYYVDRVLDRVVKVKNFDTYPTVDFSYWGTTGSGSGNLDDPEGIFFDFYRERLYVADTSNNRIAVYDETGSVIRYLTNSEIRAPTDIDYYDIAQNIILVTQRDFDEILVIDLDTDTVLSTLSIPGSTVDSINSPKEISVTADLDIYVHDTLYNDIVHFKFVGSWIYSFEGRFDIDDGTFASFDIIDSDEFWILDQTNYQGRKIDLVTSNSYVDNGEVGGKDDALSLITTNTLTNNFKMNRIDYEFNMYDILNPNRGNVRFSMYGFDSSSGSYPFYFEGEELEIEFDTTFGPDELFITFSIIMVDGYGLWAELSSTMPDDYERIYQNVESSESLIDLDTLTIVIEHLVSTEDEIISYHSMEVNDPDNAIYNLEVPIFQTGRSFSAKIPVNYELISVNPSIDYTYNQTLSTYQFDETVSTTYSIRFKDVSPKRILPLEDITHEIMADANIENNDWTLDFQNDMSDPVDFFGVSSNQYFHGIESLKIQDDDGYSRFGFRPFNHEGLLYYSFNIMVTDSPSDMEFNIYGAQNSTSVSVDTFDIGSFTKTVWYTVYGAVEVYGGRSFADFPYTTELWFDFSGSTGNTILYLDSFRFYDINTQLTPIDSDSYLVDGYETYMTPHGIYPADFETVTLFLEDEDINTIYSGEHFTDADGYFSQQIDEPLTSENYFIRVEHFNNYFSDFATDTKFQAYDFRSSSVWADTYNGWMDYTDGGGTSFGLTEGYLFASHGSTYGFDNDDDVNTTKYNHFVGNFWIDDTNDASWTSANFQDRGSSTYYYEMEPDLIAGTQFQWNLIKSNLFSDPDWTGVIDDLLIRMDPSPLTETRIDFIKLVDYKKYYAVNKITPIKATSYLQENLHSDVHDTDDFTEYGIDNVDYDYLTEVTTLEDTSNYYALHTQLQSSESYVVSARMKHTGGTEDYIGLHFFDQPSSEVTANDDIFMIRAGSSQTIFRIGGIETNPFFTSQTNTWYEITAEVTTDYVRVYIDNTLVAQRINFNSISTPYVGIYGYNSYVDVQYFHASSLLTAEFVETETELYLTSNNNSLIYSIFSDGSYVGEYGDLQFLPKNTTEGTHTILAVPVNQIGNYSYGNSRSISITYQYSGFAINIQSFFVSGTTVSTFATGTKDAIYTVYEDNNVKFGPASFFKSGTAIVTPKIVTPDTSVAYSIKFVNGTDTIWYNVTYSNAPLSDAGPFYLVTINWDVDSVNGVTDVYYTSNWQNTTMMLRDNGADLSGFNVPEGSASFNFDNTVEGWHNFSLVIFNNLAELQTVNFTHYIASPIPQVPPPVFVGTYYEGQSVNFTYFGVDYHARTYYTYVDEFTIEHVLWLVFEQKGTTLTIEFPKDWTDFVIQPGELVPTSTTDNTYVFNQNIHAEINYIFTAYTVDRDPYIMAIEENDDYVTYGDFETGPIGDDWVNPTSDDMESLAKNNTIVFSGLSSLQLKDTDIQSDNIRLEAVLDDGWYYVAFNYHLTTYSGDSLALRYYDGSWVYVELDTTLYKWHRFNTMIHIDGDAGGWNIDLRIENSGTDALLEMYLDDFGIFDVSTTIETTDYSIHTFTMDYMVWDNYQDKPYQNGPVEWRIWEGASNTSIVEKTLTTDASGTAVATYEGYLDYMGYISETYSKNSWFGTPYSYTDLINPSLWEDVNTSFDFDEQGDLELQLTANRDPDFIPNGVGVDNIDARWADYFRYEGKFSDGVTTVYSMNLYMNDNTNNINLQDTGTDSDDFEQDEYFDLIWDLDQEYGLYDSGFDLNGFDEIRLMWKSVVTVHTIRNLHFISAQKMHFTPQVVDGLQFTDYEKVDGTDNLWDFSEGTVDGWGGHSTATVEYDKQGLLRATSTGDTYMAIYSPSVSFNGDTINQVVVSIMGVTSGDYDLHLYQEATFVYGIDALSPNKWYRFAIDLSEDPDWTDFDSDRFRINPRPDAGGNFLTSDYFLIDFAHIYYQRSDMSLNSHVFTFNEPGDTDGWAGISGATVTSTGSALEIQQPSSDTFYGIRMQRTPYGQYATGNMDILHIRYRSTGSISGINIADYSLGVNYVSITGGGFSMPASTYWTDFYYDLSGYSGWDGDVLDDGLALNFYDSTGTEQNFLEIDELSFMDQTSSVTLKEADSYYYFDDPVGDNNYAVWIDDGYLGTFKDGQPIFKNNTIGDHEIAYSLVYETNFAWNTVQLPGRFFYETYNVPEDAFQVTIVRHDEKVSTIETFATANKDYTWTAYENDTQVGTGSGLLAGTNIVTTRATTNGYYEYALKFESGVEIRWFNSSYVISIDDYVVNVNTLTIGSSIISLYMTANHDGTYEIYENDTSQASGSYDPTGTSINYDRTLTAGLYYFSVLFTSSLDASTIWYNTTYSNAEVPVADYLVSVESFTLDSSIISFYLTSTHDGTYTIYENDTAVGAGSYDKTGTSIAQDRNLTSGLYYFSVLFTSGVDASTIWFNTTYSNSELPVDGYLVSVTSFTLDSSIVSLFMTSNYDGTYEIYQNNTSVASGSYEMAGTSLSHDRATNPGLYYFSVLFTSSFDSSTVWFNTTYSNAEDTVDSGEMYIRYLDGIGHPIDFETFTAYYRFNNLGEYTGLGDNLINFPLITNTVNIYINDSFGVEIYNSTVAYSFFHDITINAHELLLSNQVSNALLVQLKIPTVTWSEAVGYWLGEDTFRAIQLYNGSYDYRVLDEDGTTVLVTSSIVVDGDQIIELDEQQDLGLYSYSWVVGDDNVTLSVSTNYGDAEIRVFDEDGYRGNWTEGDDITWAFPTNNQSQVDFYVIKQIQKYGVLENQTIHRTFSYSISLDATDVLQSDAVLYEKTIDDLGLEVSSNQLDSSITITHDGVQEYADTLGVYGNFTIAKNTEGGSHNVTVVVVWTNSTGYTFTNTYIFDYWVDDYYFTVMDVIPATIGLAIQDDIDADSFNIFIDGERVLPILPDDLSDRDTSQINQTFLHEGRIYIRSTAWSHSIEIKDKYDFLIYSNNDLDLRLYEYRVLEVPIVQMFFENNLDDDIEVAMYFYNETSEEYQKTEDLVIPKSIEVRSLWVIAGNYSLRSWNVETELTVTTGGTPGQPNPYGEYTTLNTYSINDEWEDVVIDAGGETVPIINDLNETVYQPQEFWASWSFNKQVHGGLPADGDAQQELNNNFRDTMDAFNEFINNYWHIALIGFLGVSFLIYGLWGAFSGNFKGFFNRARSGIARGGSVEEKVTQSKTKPAPISKRGPKDKTPASALSKRNERPKQERGKLSSVSGRNQPRTNGKNGTPASIGSRAGKKAHVSRQEVSRYSSRREKPDLINTSRKDTYASDLAKSVEKKRRKRK